jgi:hypothetical protein
MTLLTYQNAFNMTHNDLHTNNIMFSTTTAEFITYKYKDKYYMVPTYGKIFKIIDFGRSIYKYSGIQFCSDSFATGGDAATLEALATDLLAKPSEMEQARDRGRRLSERLFSSAAAVRQIVEALGPELMVSGATDTE